MRAFMFCFLLTGCAGIAPTPAPAVHIEHAKPPRNCPALPPVPPNASRDVLLHIIGVQATMYGKCAEAD